MHFRRIISKEGWELRLHKKHEIFKNPIFKEFNFNEPVELYYCDLYLLAFNNIDYSLLSRDQVVNHLELLDKICYVQKQKELLDFAIKEFNDHLDEWKSFINPSIIEIDPNYLLTFPDLIDFNLEEFSKLNNCNDLKRKKLLQFAQDDNSESFSILFNKSLANDNFLKEIFKCGMKWIEIIIDKGFDNWGKGMCVVAGYNQAMNYSAQGGHKDLVDFFIEKGADDWNLGMYGAAQGGHKDLVDFFIEKGANNWNWGMAGAAEGGHKELVDFFIEKGANNWNCGMQNAAIGGHKNLVEFFIEKGGDGWNWGMHYATQGGWNWGMHYAAQGGYKELVDLFIEKGADDWDLGMDGAAQGGHKDLVDFFIEKGARDWVGGMKGAALGGHKDLVDFFVEKGANKWNKGMCLAAEGGHKNLVDFFINKGANNWDGGMYFAAQGGHKELVDFFIEKCTTTPRRYAPSYEE